MPPISSLTPEQESRIPLYRHKWRSMMVSTEPMDRPRARGALQAAYLLAGKAEPEFVIVNGPQQLQEFRERQSSVRSMLQRYGKPVTFSHTQLSRELTSQFTPALLQRIITQLVTTELAQLLYQLYYLSTHPLSGLFGEAWQERQDEWRSQLRNLPLGELLVQLGNGIQENLASSWQEFNHNIWQPLTEQTFMEPVVQKSNKWNYALQQIGQVFSQYWSQGSYYFLINSGILIDFCSSILDFSDADLRTWTTLRSVIRSCGIVVPWENLCLIVERPTTILLDAEGNLHGDEQPAITFADGSRFYAHHGDVKNWP